MNFQDVKNAPEKQWVDGVAITVKSFGAEPNDKFGNFIQGVVGVDAMNSECAFKVATQYEDTLLISGEIGQTLPFRLKWFNSRAGAQMQGYCTKPKKLRAVPAPQPQTAQAAPQAATQQMPPTPDWDAKDQRIVRQNTLNRAVELYIHSNPKSEWPELGGQFGQIIQLAEDFRDYVYSGPLSPGDQFAKEQGLPTAAEDAAAEAAQQHPY